MRFPNLEPLVTAAALCALVGCFTTACRERAGETTGGDVEGDPPQDDEAAPVGGYQLGSGDSSAEPGSENCDPNAITLRAVVRDFNGGDVDGGHADFETFGGTTPTLGLVEAELGEGSKPVYTGLCSEPGMSEDCPNDQQMT